MPLTSMVRPNGPRVRELRKRADLTQEELAYRLQRTRSTVMRVEQGRPVSKIVMRQIARKFCVPFGEVTLAAEGEEQETPEPEAEEEQVVPHGGELADVA